VFVPQRIDSGGVGMIEGPNHLFSIYVALTKQRENVYKQAGRLF
jgi:hypothetical protein